MYPFVGVIQIFKMCFKCHAARFTAIFLTLFFFSAPKAQGKKIAISSSDRAAVYLELVDAHMEAGQLVSN